MPALEVTKSMIVGFVCVMQGTDGAESMFEETKPTYIPTPEGYAEGAWQFDEHALSRDYIMVITKEPMML